MDIKSKNFKNKYIVTVIVLIISIAASISVMSRYSSIKKEAESITYNPYEDWDFLENIYTGNYVLYKNMIEKKTDEIKMPSDILLSQKSIEYMAEKKINSESYYDDYDTHDEQRSKEEYKNNIKNEFDNLFSNWQNSLFNNLPNLEYFVKDKEINTDISNTTEELSLLYSEHLKEKNNNTENNENVAEENNSDIQEITTEELEVLKQNYGFYAVIDYDNEGNVSILDSFGIDEKKLKRLFIDKNQSVDDYKMEPIKNMTFVYAVPEELKYHDDIFWNIRNQSRIGYYSPTYAIVGMVSLAVAFVSLIFPYKKGKDLLGFDLISQVPFEFNFIILAIIYALLYENSTNIVRLSVEGEIVNSLISSGLDANLANIFVNAINIAYWSIYFIAIFIGIGLFKNIFKVGIKKYFVRSTITGKILLKGVYVSKKSFDYIKETDFKEKPNKAILIILLTNLMILIVISSLWFFGIILAIIYTVVLFILIKKYYSKIIDKYNTLLEYTNNIAQGNLNTNIEEDLGIFEPMKEKIGSIQTGFKKAVEEELKSQGMKTELISNVSHDLKTPLTSIITYVDLLKDENIDEEKRRQYIDTLDRKSQRLKALIEDLFEMSKASSGNINLNIVDVDIVSLMKQTLLELKDQTSKSSLIIKNSFPEHKVILPLDSQRTFRIFENLIINICKYSMLNSRVYIDIINNENSVDVVLKNMSAVEIDFDVNDIVERFIRGDKSRNTEGSGLGLAIAKSFVELQKGKFNIDVDGDLFKVTITFYKN